jgi:hypothetical protein
MVLKAVELEMIIVLLHVKKVKRPALNNFLAGLSLALTSLATG